MTDSRLIIGFAIGAVLVMAGNLVFEYFQMKINKIVYDRLNAQAKRLDALESTKKGGG